MTEPEQFPYLERETFPGQEGLVPLIPSTLSRDGNSISVQGLLDTGAAVNVLPHDVGVRLGVDWDSQTFPINLTGTFEGVEARGLLVKATVGKFAPVALAFAWTKSDAHPLLLGQINFFQEFDVCFFRSRLSFNVAPCNSR